MLFLLDDKGVPSIGHIALISAGQIAAMTAAAALHAAVFNEPRPGPQEIDAETVRTAARPPVTVGITPTCPYGLAGCWGGAKGALRRLTGVETVLALANAFTSTATVFLVDDRLPDVDLWRREFTQVVNASYSLRGVEATLTGPAEQNEGQLWLRGNADRPAVRLAPLDANNKVQWDFATKAPLPLAPQEAQSPPTSPAPERDPGSHRAAARQSAGSRISEPLAPSERPSYPPRSIPAAACPSPKSGHSRASVPDSDRPDPAPPSTPPVTRPEEVYSILFGSGSAGLGSSYDGSFDRDAARTMRKSLCSALKKKRSLLGKACDHEAVEHYQYAPRSARLEDGNECSGRKSRTAQI